MLSSVLNSERAVQVNIFLVPMRKRGNEREVSVLSIIHLVVVKLEKKGLIKKVRKVDEHLLHELLCKTMAIV